MATSSSNPMAINLMPISEKLVRGNYVVWKAQVLVVLRGAQLVGFLDGTNKAPAEKLKIKKGTTEEEEQDVSNPVFDVWKAQEQKVLNYLLTTVSRDVLVQIAALPSAVEVWKHIETSFASQFRARVINTRMALATTQKGLLTAAEYISKFLR
jgi:hypothetical protein